MLKHKMQNCPDTWPFSTEFLWCLSKANAEFNNSEYQEHLIATPRHTISINSSIELVECTNIHRHFSLKKTSPSYQSCNRTVRSSRYIVFDRKSIPIVA